MNDLYWGIIQHVFQFVKKRYNLLFVCKRWNTCVKSLINCDTYKMRIICRWMIKNKRDYAIQYLFYVNSR